MENAGTPAKKKYRLDIIIIAAILLVSLSLLLIVTLSKEEGSVVVVEIDGTTVATYPLDKNAEYSLNGGSNVLVIKDGVAYMNYSNCPDHTCEKTGKIRYVGQTIICLPNKIAVTIKGDNAEGGVDFVS
ncbi:MAG: NusG domain II-containing protein [Ruminococcaceae bacterium]|nr:NusG domain II-containing protein [Oscillospiraceae bacterium]